jgi:molecular chaperone HscB
MSQYSRSTDSFRCDECSEEMAVPLFCDHCGANYPERRRMGPFAVLGLSPSFDVAEEVFEERELTLAKRLHPDGWATRGERTHKHAQLAWSAVNEALARTRDPFARAETLLEEAGAEGEAAVPQAFLIEQLELQEELEGPIDDERRKALTRTLRRELKELQRQLAGHFEIIEATAHAGSAAGPAHAAALQAAWTVVHMSRYWRNAQRALRGGAAGTP